MRGLAAVTVTFLLVLLIAGCEREDRHIRDSKKMSNLALGAAQNKDVAIGGAARAPAAQLILPQPYSPFDSSAYMVGQGKELYFHMNCVGCHASGGGGMGPPLMDDEWLYGIEPANIYQSIVEGRPNGMPSYRGKLTEWQVWQLVSYVRSMSGQLRKDVSPGRMDHMQVKPSEQSSPQENPTRQQPGAEQKEAK